MNNCIRCPYSAGVDIEGIAQPISLQGPVILKETNTIKSGFFVVVGVICCFKHRPIFTKVDTVGVIDAQNKNLSLCSLHSNEVHKQYSIQNGQGKMLWEIL